VPDRTTEVSCRIETEPARIEGRIGGGWLDVNLEPPSIALIAPDSSVVRGFRRTEADGRFTADVLLPGPLKVAVEHDGVRRWIGGETFATATTYPLKEASRIGGVDLEESVIILDFVPYELPPGQPFLRLFDRISGAVAATIEYPLSGSPFAIPNVRPGEFVLRIEPLTNGSSPWRPQWYDRAADREKSMTIHVPADGTIRRLSVTVEPGGRISGALRDAPANAAYLFYLTSEDDPTRWALGFGERSRQGFDFTGIPDGRWKIGAWPRLDGVYPEVAPVNTVWYPGTDDWGTAGILTIEGASVITGVEIVIP
jgi:hypothetical protein